MYYSSEEMEKMLKCDYCTKRFVDVVKLVPECGSSICGLCHEEVKDSVDAYREYTCLACAKTHVLPEIGLSDVRSIMTMLKTTQPPPPSPGRRTFNEHERELRTLVDGLNFRLNKLSTIDVKEEVNTYCDVLEADVRNAVESALRQVNKVGEEMLAKIVKYRARMVRYCCEETPDEMAVSEETPGVEEPSGLVVSKATKRARQASGENKDSDEEEDPPRPPKSVLIMLQQKLSALSSQNEQFYRQWKEYFEDPCAAPAGDSLVKSGLEQARAFEKRLVDLEIRFINTLFNRIYLKFRDEADFYDNPKLFGTLYLTNLIDGQRVKLELIFRFHAHNEMIYQITFGHNGELITCSKDRTIKAWNPTNGELLYKLEGHADAVYSVCRLPNDALASGSADGSVRLWDLKNRRRVRTLGSHRNAVFSVKPMPNGNVVSAAYDGTGKVWSTSTFQLLSTFKSHGNNLHPCDLSVSANNLIVTCSNEENKESILRVWNPVTGDLVKAVPTGVLGARVVVHVSDGRVAVGFINGTIKLFDVEEEIMPELKFGKNAGLFSLIALPNQFLLSGGVKPKPAYSIWSCMDGRLMQTIESGHSAAISSLCLSPDGSTLASASRDKSIKVWSLKI